MPKHNQTSYKKGHIPWSKKYDFCTLKGCDNKHEAKGFCVKHYKRLVKYGNPTTPSRRDVRVGRIKDDYALIPLGINAKDGYAKVNQLDKWIENYFWHKTRSGYAAARIEGKLIMMHRFLMQPPGDMQIDHLNRDRLDNRRFNLRICTNQENALNTGLRNRNTTGFTGVSYSKSAKKYEAYFTRNGKRVHVGLFKTAYEASIARALRLAEL